MQLNKQNILNLTDNGLDFFKFVIKDLTQQGSKCKNVKNPFYDDTKAGLSIFLKSGQWMYKDFGNETFTGDIFSFAAQHYNLSVKSDFVDILKNINRDLNLNLTDSKDMKTLSHVDKQLFHILKTPKTEAIEYQKNRGLSKHIYFHQSNAYKNFPNAVIFINHNESGFERRFIADSEELQRLVLPKTQFFGEKSNSFYDAGYDKKQEILFICEGPNNALSFVEIGFSAVATFGATNLPNSDLLKKYAENKIVILAGDGDEAGDKFNTSLALLIVQNNIQIKDLKALVFPGGKDANDLLKAGTLADYENVCQIVNYEQIKQLFADDLQANQNSMDNSEYIIRVCI